MKKYVPFVKRIETTKTDVCKRIGFPESWPSKRKTEKNKAKAAQVETNSSRILGLSSKHYQKLIKHFSKEETSDKKVPRVNMAGKVELNDAWIVESRATKHKTCNKEQHESITSSFLKAPITIPN